MKDNYTSGEIGRLCGIPGRTARRYLQRGIIAAQQNPITGRWKVSRDAIVSFLRDHGVSANHLGGPSAYRVMVVDDEEWVVSFIRETLTDADAGFAVECYTDSHQACIRLGQTRPDLLILDLRMPNIDGRQVLQAVRSSEPTRRMPVLIISGYVDDLVGLEKDPATTALGKPFTDTQLLAAVRQLLASSSPPVLPAAPADTAAPAAESVGG